MAPAIATLRGFYDECMKGQMQYSLGFFKPNPNLPVGHPRSPLPIAVPDPALSSVMA